MCQTSKGKIFPLEAYAGPRGSGRLSFRIFSTFGTIKVVRSSPLRTGRLYPQEFSWYSFSKRKTIFKKFVKISFKFRREEIFAGLQSRFSYVKKHFLFCPIKHNIFIVYIYIYIYIYIHVYYIKLFLVGENTKYFLKCNSVTG
jgi:hypothetical protein